VSAVASGVEHSATTKDTAIRQVSNSGGTVGHDIKRIADH